MPTFTVNNKVVRIKHIHNKYNGGFIMYFKLYFYMILMFIKYVGIKKKFSKVLEDNLKNIFGESYYRNDNNYWNIIKFFIGFVLKTPWWLLIKPFGWLIVIQTYYKGEIYFQNDSFTGISDDFKKRITIKLRMIPIFVFPYIINEKDIEMFIEKYA